MTGPLNRVIDLSEARRLRGIPSSRVEKKGEPVVETKGQTAAQALHEEVQVLAAKVAEAFRGEGRSERVCSEGYLLTTLPQIITDIRGSLGMRKQTDNARLRRALMARYGDASLARAALLTPKELLSLPDVGQTTLDQLLQELATHRPMTLPVLITGRKGALKEVQEIPDLFFELSRGLPGRSGRRAG